MDKKDVNDKPPRTLADFLQFQKYLDEILMRAGVPYDEDRGWLRGSDGEPDGCQG